jgi:hypothetical protein
MPDKEFYDNYNRLLKFFRDINRLLELNDRFRGILSDIPDPSQEKTFYLNSDNELTEERYRFYYAIRRRLYRKTSNIFEEYNDFLEESRYGVLLSVLTHMLDTLEPIINTMNISQIYGMRNELIEASETWLQGMEEAKDAVAENQRELVIAESGVQKQNPETDSQSVSELRNTAAARVKDAAMQTVSQDVTPQQIIEERLSEITEKISVFRQLDRALQNFTDSDFMQRVSNRFDKAPNWLKSTLNGTLSVTGLTSNDYRVGKFTLQNLMLKRKIRESGVFGEDLDKINAYWRKRVRKRYGENVPFCDEEWVEGEGWVIREEAAAKEAIVDAQIKLLERFLRQVPDDH